MRKIKNLKKGKHNGHNVLYKLKSVNLWQIYGKSIKINNRFSMANLSRSITDFLWQIYQDQ